MEVEALAWRGGKRKEEREREKEGGRERQRQMDRDREIQREGEKERENLKTSACITLFCYSFMIYVKENKCVSVCVMNINMTREGFSSVHIDSFCLN